MNAAHVHLVLVHVPIVSFGVATALLWAGYRRRSDELISAALWILIFSALSSVPVYFTGEGAEEIVEHLSGVSEKQIESHEDFAVVSFIAALLTGAAAFAASLWRRSKGGFPAATVKLVMLLACISCATMVWTGKLGGAIRHTEISGSVRD